MKITLAEKTGFCFGVKRAVAMAQKALKTGAPIYSLGSIIHNAQVVDDLSKKGLGVVKDIDEVKEGTVVISSHGISPRLSRDIAGRGLKMIDTTCPFVRKAQKIARDSGAEGYSVIIVGDSSHPEVKALVDFAPKSAIVVKDGKEAAGLFAAFKRDKVSVISQTTQSMANFLDVVRVILRNAPKELRVFNTICKDAGGRQRRARSLAGKVDLMFIVGGRESANTRRLLEVCRGVLKNSRLIETEDDIKMDWFKSCKKVGITSGASTPEWVVKKVVKRIKSKSYRKG